MTPAEAFAACEHTVRRVDADRFFAALFAPGEARPLLHTLYAFNHELARIGETARDPLAAEIRLQWWREALEAAREGRPPAHPVAVGLAELLSRHRAQAEDLVALLDARVLESSPAPFATLPDMERHAQATSARLMQAAVYAIAGTREPVEPVDAAGIAYGLAGMLRSFRFHALRGKALLPADLLTEQGLSIVDVAVGTDSAKLKRVFDQVSACALDHFRRATRNIPKAGLPAALPASLVPTYLSRLATNADPFRGGTDVSYLRKQLVMIRAALRGRL